MKRERYLIGTSGFVEVQKVTGTEDDILEYARLDPAGKQRWSGISHKERFLQELLDREVWAPFQLVDLVFLIRAPLFVKQSWTRKVRAMMVDKELGEDTFLVETLQDAVLEGEEQEFTTRYWTFDDPYWTPERDTLPDKLRNALKDVHEQWRQGRTKLWKMCTEYGYRYGLPVSVMPLSVNVEWYWKLNLARLLQWVMLHREGADTEPLVQYARVVEGIVCQHFPMTYRLWRERADGVWFSHGELEELRELLVGQMLPTKLGEKVRKGLSRV